MHVTLTQTLQWVAVGGGAWAIVRAGAVKGVLRVKAPARCADCGLQKVRGAAVHSARPAGVRPNHPKFGCSRPAGDLDVVALEELGDAALLEDGGEGVGHDRRDREDGEVVELLLARDRQRVAAVRPAGKLRDLKDPFAN